MTPLASIVDWGALGQVVLASFIGGVGVTVLVSFAIAAATRSVDARRSGHSGTASVFGFLAVAAGGACLAMAAGGVLLMITK